MAQKVFDVKGVLWGFDFLDSDRLLITLKKGQLLLFDLKTKNKSVLLSPQIYAGGQGGLLDIRTLLVNGKNFIYVTFSEIHNGKATTSLGRGTFRNNVLSNFQTIFRAKIKSDTDRHFGSRIEVNDEHLFMTIGERGERDLAQDLSWHNGKILRLTLDGKAAAGNPFSGEEGLPEIWSYGHRNPQGIAVDPKTFRLWSCEFGPRGGDELNLIEKGKNYGWPVITYGREYWGPKIGKTHQNGMEQPIAHWEPSISPSGMNFYTGNKIKDWENNLFLANLSSKHLRRLVLENNKVITEEILFKDLNERIRHVRGSPDGFLYFSTDSGKIYKVVKVDNSK